jgi:hypothetical protein
MINANAAGIFCLLPYQGFITAKAQWRGGLFASMPPRQNGDVSVISCYYRTNVFFSWPGTGLYPQGHVQIMLALA